jgi:O-antigen biosynthesis protein
MKIVAWGNSSGAFDWRIGDPLKYMAKKGFEVKVPEDGITKEWAEWADVYLLQSCTDKDGIALLYEYQQEHGKKIVVDCDDYLEMDESNPHKIEHKMFDANFVIKRTMQIADMITTTTDYLAGKLNEFNKNVVVLPNFMDLDRWQLPILKNTSNTIRIGWAGSITHLEDMKLIIEPLKKICDEFPQVQLIFVGDPRVGIPFAGYRLENMMGVPFRFWPTKLHSLRLDIGLAPLKDTEFNRCKSRIKFYEYGICQVPGVFSPTAYMERAFDGNFGMIANSEDEWYKQLRNLILCKALREDLGNAAFAHVVERCSLKRNIHLWVKAYSNLNG